MPTIYLMKKYTFSVICALLLCSTFFSLFSPINCFAFKPQIILQKEAYTDTTFWQEYQESYQIGKSEEENAVRSISVETNGTVWVATKAGIYRKEKNEQNWIAALPEEDKGPAYSVISTDDAVWCGTWKGLYRIKGGKTEKVAGPKPPIAVITPAPGGVYAFGPNGAGYFKNDTWVAKDYQVARSVRDAIIEPNGALWIATDVGLYRVGANETFTAHLTNELVSAYVKGLTIDQKGQLWVAGMGGVSVVTDTSVLRQLTPTEGVPSINTSCVRTSPDGSVWVGTDVGVVRFRPDGSRSLLFSQRWLPDDKVRAIAFDSEGTAWIATDKGVSAIRRRKMSLAIKQEYFYDILMKRHIRAPWIAGQVRLTTPGDLSTWVPEDDDNDGEFTGNYLVMESFRYATIQSPDAKEKARKAFHFLRKLKEVTGGAGLFARTIVPIDWKDLHDANRTYSPQELADELVKEPRFKPVEVRWHTSADGQWLWKGDTSSDELCGHFFGYYFYHELVADEEEKKEISQHVSQIVDQLIDTGYYFKDVDGTPTRWGVWSPDRLNRDPEWQPDRSLNSMELLAFLKLAYRVSGNEKYQREYLKLIVKEGYLTNMANSARQNPAWFVYFDVTLAAYLYPILIQCEKDPALVAFYENHMDQWFAKRRGDENPLLNFLYSYTRGKQVEIEPSVNFLRDTPLDLIDWTIDHRKREDIKLVRKPVMDEEQVHQLPPASIRAVVRWDKNPFAAVNGSPDKEREPVFWLLPYWMGRYLKMIN
jgi:streptogramin lyase